MRDITKVIAAGAVIGSLAAGLLALPSVLPAARADDEPVRSMLKTADEILPPHRVDGSVFLKPEADSVIEPWVQSDVLEEVTVRKIGYGHTEFVRIVTTATGTYSSDGLDSPHFRYPGIHPSLVVDDSEPFIALWDGEKWVVIGADGADSFDEALPL